MAVSEFARPFYNLTLIPVLVTGIQSRRVCAVKDSPAPKDLGALDSCDKHRNEGRIGEVYPKEAI